MMYKGTVTETSLTHRYIYTTYTTNPLPGTIIIHVPKFTAYWLVLKRVGGLSDQAFLIHCSSKKWLYSMY